MPALEIAVVYGDGRREVVKVGRPADLIAFADQFEKVAPDGPHVMREAAWLVHRATKLDAPFDEWVETLDELEMLGREPAAPAAADGELEQPAAAVADTAEAGGPPSGRPERPHRRIELPTAATETRIGSSSPA